MHALLSSPGATLNLDNSTIAFIKRCHARIMALSMRLISLRSYCQLQLIAINKRLSFTLDDSLASKVLNHQCTAPC